MGSAAALALTVGGLTAAGSLANAQTQAAQQRAQADALQAKSSAARQQAAIQRQKGEIEAQNYDRQRSQLRRQFEETQGRNRSLLAAGNVDMSSGSAQDVSLGNIERFAADVGENAYQKALSLWGSEQQAKTLDWQANVYNAQSSYLNKTAGNLGTSLLTAGLSGLTSGLGTYTMAGGRLSNIFGGTGGGSGLVWNTTRRVGSITNKLPNIQGWG